MTEDEWVYTTERPQKQTVRQAADQLRKAQQRLDTAIVAAASEGVPKAQIAKQAGLSRPTVYAILKRQD